MTSGEAAVTSRSRASFIGLILLVQIPCQAWHGIWTSKIKPMKDARDLEVTAASPEVIAALDLLREQWLVYGNRLPEFLPVAQRHPDVPMMNLMTALLHLSMETRQGYADAAPYLHRARAMAAHMNPRELLWLAALEAKAVDNLE